MSIPEKSTTEGMENREMPQQTKARRKGTAGKRYPLGMRTTKEIRDRLEGAAAAAGRSLAQEVEIRLERSFEHQSLLPDILSLAFGSEVAGLLIALGHAMNDAGRHHRRKRTMKLAISRCRSARTQTRIVKGARRN